MQNAIDSLSFSTGDVQSAIDSIGWSPSVASPSMSAAKKAGLDAAGSSSGSGVDPGGTGRRNRARSVEDIDENSTAVAYDNINSVGVGEQQQPLACCWGTALGS